VERDYGVVQQAHLGGVRSSRLPGLDGRGDGGDRGSLGRLDESYGMEAEHRPWTAGGQVAEHFSSGAVQESAAVGLHQLVDLVLRPRRGDLDQADYVDLRGITRLLFRRSDYLNAQGDLVAPRVVLCRCKIDFCLDLGLGARVSTMVGVYGNLRKEVPLKLQGGGLHWVRGQGEQSRGFGIHRGPKRWTDGRAPVAERQSSRLWCPLAASGSGIRS